MQTIGVSPCSSAVFSLRLTVSSVSLKYWRRSECPMMTCVTLDGSQHQGRDLAGERAFFSPVEVLRADGDIRSLGGCDRPHADQ